MRGALVALVTLVVCSVAGAGTVPGYWTVPAATRALASVSSPYLGAPGPPEPGALSYIAITGATGVPVRLSGVKVQACRGLGTHHGATFAAFSCAVQAFSASDISHTLTSARLFVRVWGASSVCGSSRSLADCPPVPVGKTLPGDPRTCGARSGSCMLERVDGLIGTAYSKARRVAVNLTCAASSPFVYTCQSGVPGDIRPGGSVAFVKGPASWSTRVTLP